VDESYHEPHTKRHAILSRVIVYGLGILSLGWLLLRSGTKPSRLAYPCQRTAAAYGLTFLTSFSPWLGLSIVGKITANLHDRGGAERAKRNVLASMLSYGLSPILFYRRSAQSASQPLISIGNAQAQIGGLPSVSHAQRWRLSAEITPPTARPCGRASTRSAWVWSCEESCQGWDVVPVAQPGVRIQGHGLPITRSKTNRRRSNGLGQRSILAKEGCNYGMGVTDGQAMRRTSRCNLRHLTILAAPTTLL
jgi:hypothetical protein